MVARRRTPGCELLNLYLGHNTLLSATRLPTSCNYVRIFPLRIRGTLLPQLVHRPFAIANELRVGRGSKPGSRFQTLNRCPYNRNKSRKPSELSLGQASRATRVRTCAQAIRGKLFKPYFRVSLDLIRLRTRYESGMRTKLAARRLQ